MAIIRPLGSREHRTIGNGQHPSNDIDAVAQDHKADRKCDEYRRPHPDHKAGDDPSQDVMGGRGQ
jgi:hypothetical protein